MAQPPEHSTDSQLVEHAPLNFRYARGRTRARGLKIQNDQSPPSMSLFKKKIVGGHGKSHN